MGKFAKRLKDRLEQYTREELKKLWDKHKHYNEVGPTCEEYFKYMINYENR